MDDPKPTSSQTPDDPPHREEPPARPSPFGSEPVEIAPVDDVTPEPAYEVAASTPAANVPLEPITDGLPGDAAPTPLVPLKEPVVMPRRSAVVESAPPTGSAAVPSAPAPRTGSFTLWMLIWLIAWSGFTALTFRRAANPQFDRSTAMFRDAARNLVQNGLLPIHGGMYVTAGNVHDNFYPGRPPLTAWILAGWMKLLGDNDMIVRALPLAFTALNLLLLYALVRRVFGAPAALATAVICSLLPMTAYYARVVSPEPFELTFLLGAALGYLSWARSGSRFGFLFLCLCVILGCWTDWPMYAFAGFLAVAHFFRRRDLLTPLPAATDAAENETRPPGRPLVASLVLIVLPMAMFALFLVYLKLNNAGFGQLKGRAIEHVAEHDGASARVWFSCGYQELFNTFKHPRQLRAWLIDLFTAPALLLAVLGMIFWPKWSRRLSLASGEAARRAAFRILLCLLLMQLAYTLAFPHAAQTQESWQYYLIVPVAVLSACLCTWLTVAGGIGRRFACGLLDRAAWSVAALIPLLAIEPFCDRVHGDATATAAAAQPTTQSAVPATATTTAPATKPAP
ncbi:MAG: dolichyl-phosphate-mannose-protein mannosyltransferase [Phycisphaerales bacterium]|nr:dolichyl-phosphate-mannose-protein mannosyltransferase [Phycisphaerales bacterium]